MFFRYIILDCRVFFICIHYYSEYTYTYTLYVNIIYETMSLSSAFRSKIRVNSTFSLHLNYGKTYQKRTNRPPKSEGISLE